MPGTSCRVKQWSLLLLLLLLLLPIGGETPAGVVRGVVKGVCGQGASVGPLGWYGQMVVGRV